jgi:hypothetical protein
MRKQFDDRVPVTVYLEREHRDALLADAKAHGRLFSEYLREMLGAKDEPAREGVRGRIGQSAEGVSVLHGSELAEDRSHASRKSKDKPACPHGLEVGWRCTLCGGKVTKEMCA